jgi:hypothetical protein
MGGVVWRSTTGPDELAAAAAHAYSDEDSVAAALAALTALNTDLSDPDSDADLSAMRCGGIGQKRRGSRPGCRCAVS